MSLAAWLLLGAFFAGLIGGVPIAFALGLAAVVGLVVADFDLVVLARRVI